MWFVDPENDFIMIFSTPQAGLKACVLSFQRMCCEGSPGRWGSGQDIGGVFTLGLLVLLGNADGQFVNFQWGDVWFEGAVVDETKVGLTLTGSTVGEGELSTRSQGLAVGFVGRFLNQLQDSRVWYGIGFPGIASGQVAFQGDVEAFSGGKDDA